MEVLNIKKYNKQQTAKWQTAWEKALHEGRNHTCLPQLAFYVWEKSYGYVAFAANKSCWAKTKREAINIFNN